VTLPQFTGDVSVLLGAVKRAEDAGLDSVWVFDHMWPLGAKRRPLLEGWSLLAFLAAHTDAIGIGTLVTRSTMRHPVVLAKMAATVAHMAPGRLIIGVGSGDDASKVENVASGLPFYAGEARTDQLSETVQVLRSYLHGEPFHVSGEYVEVAGLPPSPNPGPAPPVWVGGRSRAARSVAARHADGWNCWGASPERFATEARTVRAEAGDRNVQLSWGGLFVVAENDAEARAKLGSRDPRDYLVGGAQVVADRLAALVEAGAEHIIATFPDAGGVGNYEILGAARDSLRS